MLWSKIHLAQKVRIQMKQKATHWICDGEEWIEGRLKEIGRSSQDGATSRCISSAKIYGARRYLSIYFNTFQNARMSSGSGLLSRKMPSKRSKTLFSKAPALKYFRKSDPTQGEGDASRDGLGFLPI